MTNLLPRVEFLLQALVRRRPDCPHCRRETTDVVARKYLVVRVRHCAACDLYFTDPCYDRSAFGSLYDDLYAAEGSTTALPSDAELAALCERSFRGTDKDRHVELAELRELAGGARLLEVGSSWGYLLHQARDEGFEPTGVEVSAPRRRFGREKLGLEVAASLDELRGRSFDVVYSSHTLEHFTELSGVLERLHALLVPETGLLVLEVPHFDFARRGDEVLSSIGAVHPLGFPSGFFARNLPKAGFREVQLFERWGDVPHRSVTAPRSDTLIVVARAAATPVSPLAAVGVTPAGRAARSDAVLRPGAELPRRGAAGGVER